MTLARAVRRAAVALVVCGAGLVVPCVAAAGDKACPALLHYSAPRLQDESPQDLCRFAGRVLLVVNTASKCGYTPQYEALEQLYARYAPRGLAVLGFPSNDFNQEPAGNKAIAEFCFNTYAVKFPMFAKTTVIGPSAHPFYAALRAASGEAPQWNFHKFLVDRDGHVAATFPSAIDPLDPRVTGRIEQLLGR
ncbi:MAG TPA: glutathione peroxidase [Burkholderiaceae bacterium]|nr:glutathione peroxidase [Burkholderiaceae bacterium]